MGLLLREGRETDGARGERGQKGKRGAEEPRYKVEGKGRNVVEEGGRVKFRRGRVDQTLKTLRANIKI